MKTLGQAVETGGKMKILVTGGAGFIGSHIVECFQDKAEVHVLDNLRSGFRENLDGFPCEFIQGSILDRELVRRAMQGVDYVFHLAALVSVAESMQKPVECAETNTIGTLVVLEEAARAKVKKLVLSSSAAIYGDSPVVPKIEEMPPAPKSPYAISKLASDGMPALFQRVRPAPGSQKPICRRHSSLHRPRAEKPANDHLWRWQANTRFCLREGRRCRKRLFRNSIVRHRNL
jgi:UDP-glucose 4-epimerase